MSGPRATIWSLLAATLLAGGTAHGQDADGGIVVGAPGAEPTVVAFVDFGCPACAAFSDTTFPVLRAEFITTGRVRWELVPVALGFRHSSRALTAALCADDQGLFWPTHDLLFRRQREWQGTRNPDRLFDAMAVEVGLDPTTFARCYREKRVSARIKALTARARRQGIRGTPAFLIGERLVYGAQPLAVFRAALRKAGDSAPTPAR